MSTDDGQGDTQPVSGSRWEPEGRSDADPATPTGPVAPAPVPPAYAAPAYAAAPAATSNRGRLALAGGAVGIALVAGAGGFALGHASAGESHDDRVGPPGFGQNGFPNNGQQPPGFQHGPGGQPGADGDGRPDGDPDGDGTVPDDGSQDDTNPDDGATQGSSTT